MYERKLCFFCGFCLALLGCARNSPSPVELKVDDDFAYHPVGDFSASKDEQRIHKVTNNQTLFDVAYIYNIDPMNLAKMNGIKYPYKVSNGKILKLPSDGGGGYSSTMSLEMQKHSVDENEYPENAYEKISTVDSADISSSKEEKPATKKDEIEEKFDKVIGSSDKDVSKEEPDFDKVVEAPVEPTPVPTPVPEVAASVAPSTGDVIAPEKPSKSASKSMKFTMPVDGKVISDFGAMKDGFKNDGMNIKASRGTPVKAASGGSVIYVGHGSDKGYEDYGNVVIIQHDDEFVTSYSHLDSISVSKDSIVKAGQVIGTVGSTGEVKEPQLYFEVLQNSVPVNPHKYLQ